jgi:RNA polymerase sigma-70 factor (ECF subfamily)
MTTATITRPPVDRIHRTRTTPPGTVDYLRERSRLIGLAYRIIGSRAEAEDVVQDVWLRWQLCDRDTVENPTAFLVTATTRLAINTISSARMRHAAEPGGLAAEPVDNSADPSQEPERREALELGVQLLLEQLRPVERAAYVLRRAFDYPYPQIAQQLQISEANARQIVSRSSRRLVGERRRSAGPEERRRFLQVFERAAVGELVALEQLLTSEAVGGAGASSQNATKSGHSGTTLTSEGDRR